MLLIQPINHATEKAKKRPLNGHFGLPGVVNLW
jgi:hypothetical protein